MPPAAFRAEIHASSTINSRPSFSTGTPKRSRSEGRLSGNRATRSRAGRLLSEPRGYGDDVRAAEGEKTHRPDRARASGGIDLHVELHPGALRPAAGRTAEGVGSLQHPRAGGGCRNSGGSIRCISCTADSAQPLDGLRNHLNRRIDIGCARVAAETEAQAAFGKPIVAAERAQHIGRFLMDRGARRSRRHGDVRPDRGEQALSFDALEGDVEQVRYAAGGIAVAQYAAERTQPLPQPLLQRCDALAPPRRAPSVRAQMPLPCPPLDASPPCRSAGRAPGRRRIAAGCS